MGDSTMKITDIRAALLLAWSSTTSSSPTEWSRKNPAAGQCAVTSLVIQDLLGGRILRADVNGISHYWNCLPTGAEVDLTRGQFDRDTIIPRGEPRSRDYILSFPSTRKRYRQLKRRCKELYK